MKITAKIIWEKSPTENFLDGRYHRAHRWVFDGGMTIEASSSPEIVPVPMSDAALIDPEESFVAAISSCHMLFFLSISAKEKIVVRHYEDNPEALMGEDEAGKTSVLSIVLRPEITFEGPDIPVKATIQRIHHLAHASCFLANSVKTKISVQ